jgi:HD-GYP domain-containing protein (c-di-GMP phosphodiesterase class II)
VEVFKQANGDERYPVVTSVEEEIGACRDSRERTLDVVTNLLEQLKAGHTIKLHSVREAVNSMIASIVRNPDAFFWLARLKDKDNYAYAHCVDACGLAVAFGRHLGFSKPELENLAVGTLLFDIGKLQLPDGLLKKPGRLTDQEYCLIRRHVEFGVKMIRDMKGANKDILSIVLHHHERHNGSGYPRGIPGHKIPVNGRIAALVDCYDAITSERAYCSAVSAYDAVQLIYEWRDKDFQADMVEQFIQCIGIYPTGTLVELNTGEVGIVLAQNRIRRLRPKVMLVLDKDKIAYGFKPTVDLIEDPLDDDGNLIEIRQPLPPGTYGIDASDFYL